VARVAEDVVGGETEHRPAGHPEGVPPGHVPAELGLAPVLVAVVFGDQSGIRPGQVDASQESAGVITDLELRHRAREAGVEQKKSQTGLHRGLGTWVGDPHQAGQAGASRPGETLRDHLLEHVASQEMAVQHPVEQRQCVRPAQATAQIEGGALGRGHGDAVVDGQVGCGQRRAVWQQVIVGAEPSVVWQDHRHPGLAGLEAPQVCGAQTPDRCAGRQDQRGCPAPGVMVHGRFTVDVDVA
jgi:hypothetical protein